MRRLPVLRFVTVGASALAGLILFKRSQSVLINGFALVNRFIPWHRLPASIGIFNLLAYRDVLRAKNLHDTTSIPATGGAQPGKREPDVLYSRVPDGSYNDLNVPAMGMAGTRFGRNVPLEYVFPDPEPALLTPSPRAVANTLLARDAFKPATTLNLLAAAWIQFMTHDWFNHGTPQPGNEFQIPLAQGDTWHENPMRIRRTPADPTRRPGDGHYPPTFINPASHWWDASGIYGSDVATMHKVRCYEDGKLVVKNGRLPVDTQTGIEITGFNDNWWLGLALLHTLFTLEHNAICDRLRIEYPSWSDDQLFNTARLINAALMAKIHTVEWTPGILAHPALQIGMHANWWGLQMERLNKVFGRFSSSEAVSGIPGSPVDHHGVPYALTEEFTSVYRLHPLIPDDFEVRSITDGQLLKQLTFPDLAGRQAETVIGDSVCIEDVLYSFGIAHPGAITLHNYPRFLRNHQRPDGERIDLASIDIMRDRERGVPRYNQFRQLVHKPPVKSFDEITSNQKWAQELREVYDNDVNRVDLMVGMYAEDLPEGFGFSDTAFRIFILMASRRLKSDRFFTTDYTPEVYTQAGMNWINDNTMASVLVRHYPELKAALSGVSNAFAPWRQIG
ncbi:MAG TPA: peroxidase family protein [Herpetosiphonaceae bacterium]|nr:peroxidase family protein [Herpetosiphonaceae bacterium]